MPTGVRLFHVSEQAGINRFEPRRVDDASEPLVWAIDDERLRNHLVPRDCPRVTFYAGSNTSRADVERFLGTSPAVMVIERGWLDRVLSARVVCYQLPSESFELVDACAGYFVSRQPVEPISECVIDDCLNELGRRGVDVRVVSSLWPLHDAVAASTLAFSMIRMRNAAPRSPG